MEGVLISLHPDLDDSVRSLFVGLKKSSMLETIAEGLRVTVFCSLLEGINPEQSDANAEFVDGNGVAADPHFAIFHSFPIASPMLFLRHELLS